MSRIHLDTRTLNSILKQEGNSDIKVGTQYFNLPELQRILDEAEKANRTQVWFNIYVATNPDTGEVQLTFRHSHVKLNVKPQRVVTASDVAFDDSALPGNHSDVWSD